MTRKQLRNHVRRHFGEGRRWKVRARRERGRCVITVTQRSHSPQARGERHYLAIAPTWAQAERMVRSGFFVTP